MLLREAVDINPSRLLLLRRIDRSNAASGLSEALRNSASGKELTGRVFEDDVTVAAELNCDVVAPKLVGGASGPRFGASPGREASASAAGPELGKLRRRLQ